MPLRRRQILTTITAGFALGLAGCSGGGGAGTESQSTPTATEETGGTTPGGTEGQGSTDQGSITVQVRTHGEYGDILVDGSGMTLYMFDSDTRGELTSTCSDQCAQNWPPLVTGGSPTASDGVSATLSTFDREGGQAQVAAAGWPLYYFASDSQPGDANGQGFADVWWVLAPDGTPRRATDTPQSDGQY